VLADGQSVKIVGLGGVGGIVARYGAMFLASLAKGQNVRLVLIDGDKFEEKNSTRMFFSDYGNKAAVTRDDLLDRFADSPLTLVAVEEYVTEENVSRLLHNHDIVIAAVDNHATRKMLNDFAARLDAVVLISGGNDGVAEDSTGKLRRGTYGNCQIYVRQGGRDVSPSLTQYHPEIADPADRHPTDQSCTEQLESVPQLLLTNLATASSILNALLLHLSGALHYSELAFDIADGLMRPLPLPAPNMGRRLSQSSRHTPCAVTGSTPAAP
jgi:molybdopterin/thiamine biosynthesis adenylyltransferase